MKSYEERIPEIDKAIDHYKGKLPRKGNPNSSIVVYAFGRYYFITEECFSILSGDDEFVCYEEEFEKRAKERQIPEKYDLAIYNPFLISYEGLTKEEASAKIQAIQDLAKGSNKPNLLVSWKLLDKDGNHIAL